jgi:hypothetical protein
MCRAAPVLAERMLLHVLLALPLGWLRVILVHIQVVF